VVEEYMKEFSRVLKTGGHVFIHHSNLGAYVNSLRARLPAGATKLLTKWHILDEDHHRTPTMSAELFRTLGSQYGLHCVRQ
jgi:hypothetical protein